MADVREPLAEYLTMNTRAEALRAGHDSISDRVSHQKRSAMLDDSFNKKHETWLEWAKLAPIFPVHSPVNGNCSCGQPDCKKPAKHPRTERGFLDASQDPEQIRQWLQRWPHANIGLVTGKKLVVIDVDGPEGETALKELERLHGPLPSTWEVTTGKGRHLYYCKPEDVRIPCSNGKMGKQIDVKGDGGYVIAPPSEHISGRKYSLKTGNEYIADLPIQWLKLLCGQLKTEAKLNSKPETGRIPDGQRNDRLFQEACKLVRLGWSEDMIAEAMGAFAKKLCEKPETLCQNEIRAIVQSAIKRNPITVVEPEILSVEDIHRRGEEKVDWIVPGIIRPGLGILGARPSFGKTWWFLNAAHALSTGSPLFGQFTVSPCQVLFLTLEDSCGGLSERIEKIGLVSSSVHFSLDWPSFDDQHFGIDWLEKALDRFPKVKCVFVDPLARVEPQRKKSVNEYEFVYGWMTPVAQMARNRGIALIFSHHMGKAERAESQDNLMGSTAYAAVVDFKLFLEMDSDRAQRIFSVGGRLIPQEFRAILRLEDGRFSWIGLQSEVRKSEVDNKVLKVLREQPGGTTEIAKRLGENKSSVWNALNRLVEDGIVERNGNLYRLRTLNS